MFRGIDFYNLDELLTEDERMVRDTVRQFVDKHVLPVIVKHCEERNFSKKSTYSCPKA